MAIRRSIPSFLGSGGTETGFAIRGFVRLPKPCTRGVAWSVDPTTYDPDGSPRAPGSAGPVEEGVSSSLVGILCQGGGARAHPLGVAPGSERES